MPSEDVFLAPTACRYGPTHSLSLFLVPECQIWWVMELLLSQHFYTLIICCCCCCCGRYLVCSWCPLFSAVYLELRIQAEDAAFCVSADLPQIRYCSQLLHPLSHTKHSYRYNFPLITEEDTRWSKVKGCAKTLLIFDICLLAISNTDHISNPKLDVMLYNVGHISEVFGQYALV